MTQIIHPELSYQVRGVLLHVYNALGPMLPETYYESAIAIGLEKRGIQVQTQKPFELYYENERVGLYYPDIWLEDGKILLELKVEPAITALHKAQVISYLKVTGADLGIVANFGGARLQDQRFPNFLSRRPPSFDWQPKTPGSEWLYPELTNALFRVCYKVHYMLGSGFLHQVYRRATMIELRKSEIDYEYIKQLPVVYEDHFLGYQDVRLILVAGKILLAAFALRYTEEETAVTLLRSRMLTLNIQLGLLANFHGEKLTITPVRTA